MGLRHEDIAWIAYHVAAHQRALEDSRHTLMASTTPPPIVDAYGHRRRDHGYVHTPPKADLSHRDSAPANSLLDQFGRKVRLPRPAKEQRQPEQSDPYLCEGCGCISAVDEYEYVDIGVGIQSGVAQTDCRVCEEIWFENGRQRMKPFTWVEHEEAARRHEKSLRLIESPAWDPLPAVVQVTEKYAQFRVDSILCLNIEGDIDRWTFIKLKDLLALFEELKKPLLETA